MTMKMTVPLPRLCERSSYVCTGGVPVHSGCDQSLDQIGHEANSVSIRLASCVLSLSRPSELL